MVDRSPPVAEPPPESASSNYERVRLQQELSVVELAIADIESCLVALDARAHHRNDDLGPIAVAREGALDDYVEVAFTLSGPREQLEDIDLLLRHISHTTRLGQRQIYRVCVDAGGYADIHAERDGELLRVDEDEERWTDDPPPITPHGRRITYGREPLDLFVD